MLLSGDSAPYALEGRQTTATTDSMHSYTPSLISITRNFFNRRHEKVLAHTRDLLSYTYRLTHLRLDVVLLFVRQFSRQTKIRDFTDQSFIQKDISSSQISMNELKKKIHTFIQLKKNSTSKRRK